MNLTYISRVCHEINVAICNVFEGHNHPSWDEAPEWQRSSSIDGVRFAIGHPDASPEDQHNRWMDDRRAEGWQYGPVKDEANKIHPCMVPYDQLSQEQRLKDHVFLAVVRAMVRT
ncbi:MAG: hypothetical protein FD153_32 [Rhodospirillaceae bacterium]|nr:MAG: hypothetical protein FD153_32 [Rhodospirillaceae bacterium]